MIAPRAVKSVIGFDDDEERAEPDIKASRRIAAGRDAGTGCYRLDRVRLYFQRDDYS